MAIPEGFQKPKRPVGRPPSKRPKGSSGQEQLLLNIERITEFVHRHPEGIEEGHIKAEMMITDPPMKPSKTEDVLYALALRGRIFKDNSWGATKYYQSKEHHSKHQDRLKAERAAADEVRKAEAAVKRAAEEMERSKAEEEARAKQAKDEQLRVAWKAERDRRLGLMRSECVKLQSQATTHEEKIEIRDDLRGKYGVRGDDPYHMVATKDFPNVPPRPHIGY